ncbi:proline--tRNA ligase [Penicillium cosmopolitanum]|uniref:proline--tRNA ligase n=1 Tax=Penicillium cosmopolitanum TaxID=1131564 RepID=A0A9W9W3P1_9EURO|nr:proline--tRNA ligase [Penicillium cosmopolitanum]KAJ5398016.1 proline--tRNA ligase [Penicillium cosmopolitanum]
MASQTPTDPAATSAAEPQTLPDRTNPADAPQGESKNAAKKAAKLAKLAADKADKANKPKQPKQPKEGKQEPKKAAKKKDSGKELIGIDVEKESDFPEWYHQVLTKGDMLDYYDVSGCFILKPASYFVWEEIQNWFNVKIKSIGVKNASFPLFVSEDVLQREKDHIEGFAAEVAWRKLSLEKKIAIRPTSETVMYPYYSKWIRSHRNLPLRLNQWNSVVRWEFKNPTPFLRTREFLWQEGHTAHLGEDAARAEVLQILDWYSDIYEHLLAVPVVKGQKTDKERFAGGLYTTTVEGYIPATGRGIQGGTSHGLGQNFSKMFDIKVEDPSNKPGEEKKPPLYVWQNSWGLSTRTIGVMVMIHSDNKGLVLPPRVAETQVVIVPVGLTAKTTAEEREKLNAEIEGLAAILQAAGVRVENDQRDGYSPGFKFADWELKGVPLRLEFGPGESAGHFVSTARRDIPGKEGKGSIPIPELGTAVPALLETIHQDMYNRANEQFTTHRKVIEKFEEIVPALNDKNLVVVPFCLAEDCEDQIKKETAKKQEEISLSGPEDVKAPSMGAKSLCIPFDQGIGGAEITAETKCINPKCTRSAQKWCMFGRSY